MTPSECLRIRPDPQQPHLLLTAHVPQAHSRMSACVAWNPKERGLLASCSDNGSWPSGSISRLKPSEPLWLDRCASQKTSSDFPSFPRGPGGASLTFLYLALLHSDLGEAQGQRTIHSSPPSREPLIRAAEHLCVALQILLLGQCSV